MSLVCLEITRVERIKRRAERLSQSWLDIICFVPCRGAGSHLLAVVLYVTTSVVGIQYMVSNLLCDILVYRSRGHFHVLPSPPTILISICSRVMGTPTIEKNNPGPVCFVGFGNMTKYRPLEGLLS